MVRTFSGSMTAADLRVLGQVLQSFLAKDGGVPEIEAAPQVDEEQPRRELSLALARSYFSPVPRSLGSLVGAGSEPLRMLLVSNEAEPSLAPVPSCSKPEPRLETASVTGDQQLDRALASIDKAEEEVRLLAPFLENGLMGNSLSVLREVQEILSGLRGNIGRQATMAEMDSRSEEVSYFLEGVDAGLGSEQRMDEGRSRLSPAVLNLQAASAEPCCGADISTSGVDDVGTFGSDSMNQEETFPGFEADHTTHSIHEKSEVEPPRTHVLDRSTRRQVVLPHTPPSRILTPSVSSRAILYESASPAPQQVLSTYDTFSSESDDMEEEVEESSDGLEQESVVSRRLEPVFSRVKSIPPAIRTLSSQDSGPFPTMGVTPVAAAVPRVARPPPGFAPLPQHQAPLQEETDFDADWILTGVEWSKQLGKGGFGTVMLVKDKSTGLLYAVKMINLNREVKMKDVKSEHEMAGDCAHPNIIQSMSCLEYGPSAFIVMEYCDLGGLDSLSTLLNESAMKYVIHSLLSGLGNMHGLQNMHRDIKPENVLVNRRGEIKLADLGLACPARPDGRNAMAGTLDYFPPEFLLGEFVRFGMKADVWALGVLIFAMFEGQTPLERIKRDISADDSDDFDKDISFLLAQTLDLRRAPNLSDELVRFLGRMTAVESERATVSELLLDPYMNQVDWSVEKEAFQQVGRAK